MPGVQGLPIYYGDVAQSFRERLSHGIIGCSCFPSEDASEVARVVDPGTAHSAHCADQLHGAPR
eukprot:10416329-Alexandrium_andersonii.AAC.1